jgi:hypothetical protein
MSASRSASTRRARVSFHQLGVRAAYFSLASIVLMALPVALGLPWVVASVAILFAIWIGIESLFSP